MEYNLNISIGKCEPGDINVFLY